MSSKILNSKNRGKLFNVSERDKNLISGALSLIWVKTNHKVETCTFEGDVVTLSYNHKLRYFDIYESIDDIDSLLSDFTREELEDTKRKLNNVSNELEDYKNRIDLLSRENINLQNELQKYDQSICDTATSSTRDTVVSSDDERLEPADEITDHSTTSNTIYPATSESKFEDSIAIQEVRVVIESNFKELELTSESKSTAATVKTPKLKSAATSKSESEASTPETHNLRSETSKSRLETAAATKPKLGSAVKEKISTKENEKLNKSKKRKLECILITSGGEEEGNNRDDDNVEIININPKDQGLSPFQSLLLDKGKKLREILLTPNDTLESNSKIINALRELTSKPLNILDESSAEDRIYQWQKQESQCEKFQLGAESYNFLHLMSLVQIYDDILRVGEELKKDPKNDIDDVKLWVIEFLCDKLKIDSKTEQKNRLGCNRLRKLFNEGITSDQLVQAGCFKDDFFVKPENYSVFLSQIPSLKKRRDISLNNYLKEILSLKISNIDLENLTFSQSNIPKFMYNNEESDDIEVLSFTKNTQNNESITKKHNTSNKKQKIKFKLHLGKDFNDIAHKYKEDEYIAL
ncbi:uncharacterized protein OCT59_014144 [Rhizophagus irregularis]|uniref:Uncharacterized protein n=2 Tax=Rhizophagus irregularis TaxID=588596 RepID=A0A015JAV4_RHIIW|nr:hypothetical protein GLOIN_2v1592485 [Rhizophagus irregularis DAOM 181602=DAOM 197198]EXX64025.1 hypothetical protein RirG_146800 [Rhizophagus irregularis DAOM 197198w]POG72825.1 hypothetical protein GLOIN_2v1592485 [Rhizophagus irregularis DAOM 181602=DAOM 197198]UZO21759.1 hypothetical protein OCT59_014144 [Rhizophagus irregularis]|eukprot:XP_025179691.1 hypothetical protein GLOIN_2v1592485 [Rhizophagus irregularis DAOM 181602=DAOM 197198]